MLASFVGLFCPKPILLCVHTQALCALRSRVLCPSPARSFVLSNKQGMHFGVHGPVDQGAYNEFYQPAVRTFCCA